MKIVVYNLKGGVGKTSISLNLALTMKLAIITNEPLSPLEVVLEEKRFIKLSRDDDLPVYPNDLNILFDLGGYLDQRAGSALKQSDCVIVPVVNEFLDMHTTLEFIQDIEAYNKNIIVVANKTQKGDFDFIKKAMREHYPDYPVLEIKQSRALPNILKYNMSVHEMAKANPLAKYSYKKIVSQFDDLIKTINQNSNEWNNG